MCVCVCVCVLHLMATTAQRSSLATVPPIPGMKQISPLYVMGYLPLLSIFLILLGIYEGYFFYFSSFYFFGCNELH